MRYWKIFAQFFAGLSAALLLSSAAAEPDGLAAVKERGVLRVGVAEIAPWLMHTGLGENLIGYEVDSTGKLAEHLGVERDFIVVPFGELAYALRDGRFDIIASGYSMSEDRRQIIDFSLPYNRTAYKLVISKQAAEGRQKVSDFNKKNLTIGYLLGGVSEDVAKTNFRKANLTPFEFRADALTALIDGEIDGFVGSDPFYSAVVLARPDAFVVPIEDPLFMSIEAFAVQKGDEAFLDALNSWVVAEEQAGTFKDLHTKWFKDLLWLSVMREMDPHHHEAAEPPE